MVLGVTPALASAPEHSAPPAAAFVSSDTIANRANALLGQMSVEHKVAQLIQ
ncbi:MAG: hypothetical protein RLZZ136_126, partial [Pseudomonadota bacterium]